MMDRRELLALGLASLSTALTPRSAFAQDRYPERPIKLMVAFSAGTGTMSNLSGELFKQLTGLNDLVHIPYKGAGPGIADLVSGHIPMMTPNVTGQVLEFHRTGKIRILAINAAQRLDAVPEIAT